MSDKSPHSLYLTEKYVERAKERDTNLSLLVDTWLGRWSRGEPVVRESDYILGEMARLEAEHEAAREQNDRVMEAAAEVYEKLNEIPDGDVWREDVDADELEYATNALSSTPRDETNPAVRNHAENLGVPAETLVNYLRETDEETDGSSGVADV